MKRIWAIPAILMLLLMLGACGLSCADREVESALICADSLMESRPDSALAILTAIDHSAIRSDALRARYSLLSSHARLKNYLPLESDSLVNFAVDYYTTHSRGNAENLMRAEYYRSVLLTDCGDYAAAAYSALKSEELATTTESPIWQARAHDLLARISHSTYNIESDNIESEICHLGIASAIYAGLDSLRNAQCCLIDMATALSANGETDRGLQLLDSVSATIPDNDGLRRGYAAQAYTQLYVTKEDSLNAADWLRKAMEYGYFMSSPSDLHFQAMVALLDKDLDSARIIIDSISQLESDADSDPIWDLLPAYRYRYLTGDYKAACDTLVHLYNLQIAQIRHRLRQSEVVAEMNYKDSQSALMQMKYDKDRTVFIICAVAVALVLCVLIILLVCRNRRRQIASMIAVENFRALLRQFESELESADSARTKSLVLFMDILEEFKTLYNDRDSDKYHIVIKRLSSDRFLSDIVEVVDQATGKMLHRLTCQVPSITKSEIQYIALNTIGFEPGAVCAILGFSMSNYYSRKTRIKQKINKATPLDETDFMTALNGKYKDFFLATSFSGEN